MSLTTKIKHRFFDGSSFSLSRISFLLTFFSCRRNLLSPFSLRTPWLLLRFLQRLLRRIISSDSSSDESSRRRHHNHFLLKVRKDQRCHFLRRCKFEDKESQASYYDPIMLQCGASDLGTIRSTHLYVFQGPSDLMPPDGDLNKIRKARAATNERRDREESLACAKREASLAEGISRGMGEEAIEEDPEVAHMKKEIDAIKAKDINQGGLTQIAINELRITERILACIVSKICQLSKPLEPFCFQDMSYFDP